MKNSRYKSTEDAIDNAVFSLLKRKKYDDFTVSDICKEAKINRSSFYAHYQDINDLMIKIESLLSQRLKEALKPISNAGSGDVPSNPFVAFFEYVLEHKVFYRAFLRNNSRSFSVNDILQLHKEQLGRLATKKGFNYTEAEIEYHLYYFGGGLKAVCARWIQNDCIETPEQMAKVLEDEYKNNALFLAK